MNSWVGYALGYDAGRSDARTADQNLKVVQQILYGVRTVTVDQLYIDQLLAALAGSRATSDHNFDKAELFYAEALDWKDKAYQFHGEALSWRDEYFNPLRAKAERLRQDNAALRALLEERNPDLAAEQDAHQKTHEEKQSLHCFRLVATAILDALLAGRADRPEFAELVAMVKEGADVIDRGGLFFGFSETPEKAERLDALTDALARP